MAAAFSAPWARTSSTCAASGRARSAPGGGGVTTWLRERVDVAGVTRPVTADDLGSFVLFLADGEVATVTLSAVAHHGPGDLTQITSSEGTIQLTHETKLEGGRGGAWLGDIGK